MDPDFNSGPVGDAFDHSHQVHFVLDQSRIGVVFSDFCDFQVLSAQRCQYYPLSKEITSREFDSI